jgi:septal ring factor EnvC (AmiA/AmiB activator)
MEQNVELQIADLTTRVSAVEQRLVAVEQRLVAVEQDVAVIKSNYATKADVVEATNRVITWVISAVFLAQLLPLLLKKLGM